MQLFKAASRGLCAEQQAEDTQKKLFLGLRTGGGGVPARRYRSRARSVLQLCEFEDCCAERGPGGAVPERKRRLRRVPELRALKGHAPNDTEDDWRLQFCGLQESSERHFPGDAVCSWKVRVC